MFTILNFENCIGLSHAVRYKHTAHSSFARKLKHIAVNFILKLPGHKTQTESKS